MKKIKLDVCYSEFKEIYYLPLEYGNKIVFKNKRTGIQFVALYKKFLTDNINSLLYNYSRVHTVFMDYYLQFDIRNTMLLNKINNQILKKIDLVYRDFGKGWTGLVFTNLEAAYKLIHELIDYLKVYAQKFKIQNLIYKMNAVLHSYWNDFNAHREAQTKIFDSLKYREAKLLSIAYKSKKILVNQ
jgi:hypothetical protein